MPRDHDAKLWLVKLTLRHQPWLSYAFTVYPLGHVFVSVSLLGHLSVQWTKGYAEIQTAKPITTNNFAFFILFFSKRATHRDLGEEGAVG